MQQTIKQSFSLSGICLHSGKESNIIVHPAPANTGIKFKRVDLNIPSEQKIIDTSITNIVSSKLCTSIQNKYFHRVNTIEHLMSAFHGLGVDNALVDIDSDEVPILDGSSKKYVEKIDQVGLKLLKSQRRFVKILKPLIYGDTDSYIKIMPSDYLSIDYTIIYSHKLIKEQNLFYEFFNSNSYKELISSSRTFGFKEEVDILRKGGLIKGGSIDNAIVLDSNGLLNKDELRFQDEFVRHKILDLIGDLFLFNCSPIGHVEVYCGGHSLTHELLKMIISDQSNWKYVDKLDLPNSSQTTFRSDKEVSAII